MIRYPIFFQESELELLVDALSATLQRLNQELEHIGRNYSDAELYEMYQGKIECVTALANRAQSLLSGGV